MMCIDDIYKKISIGSYKSDYQIMSESYKPENFVFDENKTVKWNREQVNLYNENLLKNKEECMRLSSAKALQFKEDCIEALENDYNFNRNICVKIFAKANSEQHMYGHISVLEACLNYADFVKQIISLIK